jgi:outer membrane protein OmpA-like peptidoglycan-associated protein
MEQKRPMTGIVLGFLGIGAAGGLGYYAWELRGRVQALSELSDRALIDKRLCDESLQRERVRGTDLDSRLVGCADERAKAQTEKSETEKLKTALEANLSASREELEELRKQRALAEGRLAAFRALTEKFRKMIDTGQIKVLIRDGRMIMKLPEDILFASGSAELSDKGKAALSEVASNLKTLPERNFMVAGHTDNVPPSKYAQYRSNSPGLRNSGVIPILCAAVDPPGFWLAPRLDEDLPSFPGSPRDHARTEPA